MSLITVDLRDRKQLYEQIIDSVRNLILTGELQADDRLPSVRSLAQELGINPNTIQKAYTELERAGIIASLPGRGSFVSSSQSRLQDEQAERLTEKLQVLAGEAIRASITEKAFIQAAQKAYRSAEGENHD